MIGDEEIPCNVKDRGPWDVEGGGSSNPIQIALGTHNPSNRGDRAGRSDHTKNVIEIRHEQVSVRIQRQLVWQIEAGCGSDSVH